MVGTHIRSLCINISSSLFLRGWVKSWETPNWNSVRWLFSTHSNCWWTVYCNGNWARVRMPNRCFFSSHIFKLVTWLPITCWINKIRFIADCFRLHCRFSSWMNIIHEYNQTISKKWSHQNFHFEPKSVIDFQKSILYQQN